MKRRLGSYLIVGFAGAAAGGAVVAITTEALPRLARSMVRIMADEMARRGFSPDT